MSEQTTIQPNVIKLGVMFPLSLIWDYYAYIDRPEYTIDNIINEKQIPVKFLPQEYKKPGTNYVFCFVKCRHKYSDTMIHEVFPKLHKLNMAIGGQEYLKLCEKAANVLLNYAGEKGGFITNED